MSIRKSEEEKIEIQEVYRFSAKFRICVNVILEDWLGEKKFVFYSIDFLIQSSNFS